MNGDGSLGRLDAPELNGATCIIAETGYFFKTELSLCYEMGSQGLTVVI